MPAVQETVDRVRQIDVDQYRYGFETIIESEKAPKGLSEDTVRFISAKKNEPEWMLEWRLEAFRRWQTMEEPTWALVHYPPIDYQAARYYAAPKAGAVYNLGGGRASNVSMLEAIALCERIAGRPLDWTLSDEARIGDHRWWVSDLSDFRRDHPGWDVTHGIEDVLREIHDANAERWSSAC